MCRLLGVFGGLVVCWLKFVVVKQMVVGLTLTTVLACKMGAMFWLGVA